jgi:hypothetical protein
VLLAPGWLAVGTDGQAGRLSRTVEPNGRST